MCALQRWTMRGLAVIAVLMAGTSTASAQPGRNRPNHVGGGFQPQINTSPYANGSIQRALAQQQLGIALQNNPYGFYQPTYNPWLVRPVVVNPVNPVFFNPTFTPQIQPWTVNPWMVNPAIPAYYNPGYVRPITPFRPW